MNSSKKSKRYSRFFLAALLLMPVVGIITVLKFQGQIPALRLDYFREKDRRFGCQNNLRQIWLATRQYSSDYDGRLPPVVVGGTKVKGLPRLNFDGTIAGYVGTPVGWADALTIYIKSPSLYMCPAEAQSALAPSAKNYSDYWMNANLSAQAPAKIQWPTSTLFLGEGNDGTDRTDATYAKNALPPQWLSSPSSPAYRHFEGANYLMADGTVQWLRPDKVTTFGGRKNAFALR